MAAEDLAKILFIVQAIAERLVDRTDALQVSLRGDGLTIQVLVSEGDLGKIIGKQGHTVRAIRTLVDCMAIRYGARLRVDIATAHRLAAKPA